MAMKRSWDSILKRNNGGSEARPVDFPIPGPQLRQYGRDLTRLAVETRPLIGRDMEVMEVFEVLLRWRHNNALILGRSGVGKTSVIIEVARRMALGTAPAGLSGRGVVELNMRTLVAGASMRGQLEERSVAIVRELQGYHGSLVIVFDDLPALLTTSSTSGVDFIRLFGSILEYVETPTLATADSDLLREQPTLKRQIEAQFQMIQIDEPPHPQVLEMLEFWMKDIEAHHGVSIALAACEHAAHLARRFLKSRALPDSALSLLDQAAAATRLAGDTSITNQVVGAEQVATVASRWTGIPLQNLLNEEAARLANLESVLHQRVVGQNAAVAAVANAVRRVRARLADPSRPVGSFLFLGPTGVGKTELARALATLLFQDEAAMVRIDMSEYMERHQIARLIGAPPGYVGYDKGGQLTDAVRQRPYSIVLLDELEKAHTDVFNLLLQILEDGRLTDGLGQTIDFRQAVIIMTSNCGSQHIVELSDASEEEVRTRVMADVRAQFKPELLNRIDEIIVFHRLGREEIRNVVDIQVTRLQGQLATEYGLELLLTPSARDWLAVKGYDIEYGARPLKRLIRRELEDKLALGVMAGTVRSGGGRVLVDVEIGKAGQGGSLVITTEGTRACVPSIPSHVVQTTEGIP
ncbi:MAG: ATP-dependent Clp protease ATP-binding subunit [Ktedonobacteraceae bacterium]